MFYYDFNNRRTIKINGGKLLKGKCYELDNGNYKYNFTFVDNSFDYIKDTNITFNLNTSFDQNYSKQSSTICSLNLSGNDNTSYCSIDLDKCPNEEDDIYIQQTITRDYNSNLSPNSIFYFDFNKKNTITIKTTDKSKIIKEEKQFIITNNIVMKDIESFDITIEVKISGQKDTIKY